MINKDESALICDLAETYNIYDYRSYPLMMVATFCVGLRDDSRIKLKLNNLSVSFETVLLSMVVDRLGLLVWSKSKDATKGMNRPKSVVKLLLNEQTKNNIAFSTAEDFEKAKREILRGGGE